MNPSPRQKWHGAWALVGVLSLAFLPGCSSPGQPAPIKGVGQEGVQAPPLSEKSPPPSTKTLYSMAQILATQGKDVECEFVLRRCISEYPLFTPAYNSLAELHLRQGRGREAIAVLSKALEVRPRDPVLLNNLGMCFLVRKEYAEALTRFTEAAGIVPESEKYRANMATCLGLLGRPKESLALLQQVLPDEVAQRNVEILRKACEDQAGPTEDSQS